MLSPNGRKVTHTHSESPHEFSNKETNWLVLFGNSAWVNSILKVQRILFRLTQSNNSIKQAEEWDHDKVKEHENSQIIDNAGDHDNNGGQAWENSKEEECFVDNLKND